MARTYWLSTWLKEFSETTGRLRGIARDDLLEETGEIEMWAARDDRDAPWRFERNEVSEVWRILRCIAHSSLAIENDVRWLHTFDYKDSDAWSELGPMVGVADAELMVHLRRLGEVARSRGETVEVPDFVDLCNAHARNGLRLFYVDTYGDDYLYVALPPAACAQAVERGLLPVDPSDERATLVGASLASPPGTPPITVFAIGFACVIAAVAVVYAVIAVARGGSPVGSLAIVIALVVVFEFAKSRAIGRLDAALGGRHPTLMRVLKALTRT